MLSFEVILKTSEVILLNYEVVSTSHGYTLLAWEPRRKQWYSAEILETPEIMLLTRVYASYLESKFTGDERDELIGREQKEIDDRFQQMREE